MKVERGDGREKEWENKEARKIIFAEQAVFFRMIEKNIE